MSKIFIVIPAYNEEKTIAKVIEGLLQENYNNIVIVNDGSADCTSKIVLNYPVYLLTHNINRGQGAALRTGTEFAVKQGADIVIHFDGDGQHQVKEIDDFVEKINQGFDIAIGSRFLSGAKNIPFTKKYLIHKPAILVNWFFSGLKLTDAHNGFRALNRHAAKKIKITQNRMAHNTEIPAEIVKRKLNFTEVPVEVIYTEYGQGFGGGIKIILDLLKQKILN